MKLPLLNFFKSKKVDIKKSTLTSSLAPKVLTKKECKSPQISDRLEYYYI